MLYQPPENAVNRLRPPSVVPRESLRNNGNLHWRLAELGLAPIIDVESTSNVLVVTRNRDDHVVAAGVYVKPEYQLPEIHIRTGEVNGFVTDKDGNTVIKMEVDELSATAAAATCAALFKIARGRDEWVIQELTVGTPSAALDSGYKNFDDGIAIPALPISAHPGQHVRIAC